MTHQSASNATLSFLLTSALMIVAQAEIRVPSDANLERMQERAITTSPLDVSGAPRMRGGEEAEIRQMDERARRIDENLTKGGAICSHCK